MNDPVPNQRIRRFLEAKMIPYKILQRELEAWECFKLSSWTSWTSVEEQSKESKHWFISAELLVRWPGHSGHKHPLRDWGHEMVKPVAAPGRACALSRCMNKHGGPDRLLGRVHNVLNSCLKKLNISHVPWKINVLVRSLWLYWTTGDQDKVAWQLWKMLCVFQLRQPTFLAGPSLLCCGAVEMSDGFNPSDVAWFAVSAH